MRIACFVIAAAVIAQTLGAQTTWVVPTQAPSLQAAVNLASPGDVVTTAPGFVDTTANITINKALTLRDCTISIPWIPDGLNSSYGVIVTGISGGDTIRLLRLNIADESLSATRWGARSVGVSIALPTGASGRLSLEAVVVRAGMGRQAGTALSIASTGSTKLYVRNSQFFGSSGDASFIYWGESGTTGGDAAVVNGGFFEDCLFSGGAGGPGLWGSYPSGAYNYKYGQRGGRAIVAGPNATFIGCTATEGNGGSSFGPPGGTGPCNLAGQPGVSSWPGDSYGVAYNPGRAGSVSGCAPPATPPTVSLGPVIDLQVATPYIYQGQSGILQCASLDPSLGISFLMLGIPLQRVVFPFAISPIWTNNVLWFSAIPAPNVSGWATVLLPAVPVGLNISLDFLVQVAHAPVGAQVSFGTPRMLHVNY
jgi:hypothetical protein